MPRGTYIHLEDGAREHFQCAPGPAGWRYVAERADGTRVDLTTDARWRQARVEIGTPGRSLRGGVAGRQVLWIHRSGTEPPTEHAAEAAGLLGESPGFLVAVARWLRLGPAAQADVRLVRLSGPALAPLTIAQRWRLAEVSSHDTDLRPLLVEHFQVTDLATAETGAVDLAGDVILAAPGIELGELESPPSDLPVTGIG